MGVRELPFPNAAPRRMIGKFNVGAVGFQRMKIEAELVMLLRQERQIQQLIDQDEAPLRISLEPRRRSH